jgi:hypothetical protein
MSYNLTRSDGVTPLLTLADGQTNSTATSLVLIGKNYAGYGTFLNENFIKLLENFSYSSAPNAPLTGQLWYHSTEGVLKVYNGQSWKPISSSAAGPDQPNSPVLGDLWWDTASNQLKVWSGAAWVAIGPGITTTSGGGSTTGVDVTSISATSGGPFTAIRFQISNTTIAIISRESTPYTPQPTIAGFPTINPGLNLISPGAGGLSGSQFTGNASSALTLQGLSASQFLRSDQNTSTSFTITSTAGFNVSSDLEIRPGSEIKLEGVSNNKDISFWVRRSGTPTKAVSIIGSTAALQVSGSILPNTNDAREIGSNSLRFANVWATTFRGTAITAQYADLAERFEADVPMEPGTVVELGGTKEITQAVQELSDEVFGVISTLPGFLMNGSAGTDVTHPAVAVNGRVPVRVIGKVKKGDRLVSAGRGLARAARKDELTAFNVLGRALENKTSDSEGLVEAIVKLNS